MNVALPVVAGPEASLVLAAGSVVVGIAYFVWNNPYSYWADPIYTMVAFFKQLFCP